MPRCRRDVIFMNAEDESRSLKDGDRIEVQGLIGTADDKHLVSGFTAVAYDIPRSSIAGYYPEMNVVMSLRHFDRQSGTPSYKGVPVKVKRKRCFPRTLTRRGVSSRNLPWRRG